MHLITDSQNVWSKNDRIEEIKSFSSTIIVGYFNKPFPLIENDIIEQLDRRAVMKQKSWI